MIDPRVRIKMCGMSRVSDIAHATALGVDAIGLIFYPKSRRYLDIMAAKMLLQSLSVFVDVVAVFVNPEATYVRQVIAELPIQYLQFHGEESPEFCEQFGKSYIKAVPAISADEITKLADQHKQATAILLDTPTSSHGGCGMPFDWQIIPRMLNKPIILAGGLDSFNVGAAIKIGTPYAVDVCSGVEVSPGIKDHVKMSQFVNTVWGKK